MRSLGLRFAESTEDMGLWDKDGSNHRETPEEKLRRKLSKNPYYPFTCIDETKNKRGAVLHNWFYIAHV